MFFCRETPQRVRHERAVVPGGLRHHGQVSCLAVCFFSPAHSRLTSPHILCGLRGASVPSATEISGMLHTSRPDNSSDVLLQLHTAPNCQYKVTVRNVEILIKRIVTVTVFLVSPVKRRNKRCVAMFCALKPQVSIRTSLPRVLGQVG